MANRDWITELAQKRNSARESAASRLERIQKAREERDQLVAPFWDAFVGECESIVKKMTFRLAKQPGSLGSVMVLSGSGMKTTAWRSVATWMPRRFS